MGFDISQIEKLHNSVRRKLELLYDNDVKQIVFDILHKKSNKYAVTNVEGQHTEYKQIFEELKNTYKNQLKAKV